MPQRILGRRQTEAWVVPLVVVLSLSACGSDPAAESPAPSPSASFQYRPPPDEDPTNPLLIAYCSAQDRVVTLEGQLLSSRIPLQGQLTRMWKAQRAAQLAADTFQKADRPLLARLTRRWAQSFVIVRKRLEAGQQEIDALTPAIAALGRIEPVFSCELDV